MKRDIFIAGIIQGSCRGKDIFDQNYRRRLTILLRKALPKSNVFCPVEEHPQSVDYASVKARDVFFDLMNRAAKSDILVAFLPQASLGTAIELWQAHQAKKIIFTISPMTENWVIKFLTNKNFLTLEDFEKFVTSGAFRNFVEEHNGK
ncbi:MAG: hypothetical protein WC975_01245 [Phycisphaerae bacterium]